MADKVDIRIMAHKSRADNVQKLLEALSLPEAAVTWDDRKDGGDALYTARKAWFAPMPKGCTHRVVLADDAETCEGFREIVEILAANHPDDIYTLFQQNALIPGAPVANVCSKMVYGVGIMLPKDLIHPIFDEPIRPEDDMSVTFFAYARALRILTPMPSIVQHLQMPSLLGNALGITSASYTRTPKQDWTSKEIIDI